tara:strand:- start:1425 stop:2297 length:873 start_codon:yes stop_codon:yes gene_type:complete
MSGLSFLLLLLAAAVLISGLRAYMYAAQALVLANFALFATWWLAGTPVTTWLELGFRPGYLTEPGFAWATLLTALFLHAGPLHLLMNMLVLLLLGAPFEERIGTRRLLIVFFAGGLLASLGSGLLALWQGQDSIHIGASGAVFAVMGAFALLYPRDEIPMLLGPLFLPRVPVILAALVFMGGETAYVAAGISDGVGHTAHAAGFVAGVFMAPLLRPQPDTVAKMASLEHLSSLEGADEELRHAMEADEPELRAAWLEKFLERAYCPECSAAVSDPDDCSTCAAILAQGWT